VPGQYFIPSLFCLNRTRGLLCFSLSLNSKFLFLVQENIGRQRFRGLAALPISHLTYM